MSLQGELAVTLACDATGVRNVTIASTRPSVVSRVLVGRRADDAVALVPRLFAVCAHAQGAAASAAIGAARGTDARVIREARELAVALETIQEDLWRLLVDWPPLADAPADVEALARARRSATSLIDALAPHVAIDRRALADLRESVTATLHSIATLRVFGETPAAFVARADEPALRAWASRTQTPPAMLARALLAGPPRLGASDVAVLALDRATVEDALLPALDRDPEFARAPEIDGRPRETGALDRTLCHPAIASLAARDGNGARARLFARLMQLATTLEALRGQGAVAPIDSWSPQAGEGAAVVRTARGALLHRARVEGDAIGTYAIVAPTEWTFHPRGAVARGLASVRSEHRDAMRRDAEVILRLADACVPCSLELADA